MPDNKSGGISGIDDEDNDLFDEFDDDGADDFGGGFGFGGDKPAIDDDPSHMIPELTPEELEQIERERTLKAKQRAARWVAGGFCGCVIFIVVLLVASYYVYDYYQKRADQFAFNYRMYNKIEKDNVVIDKAPVDNLLIIAQTVEIKVDCGVNFAIRAERCKISSVINGVVVIDAQFLEVDKGALISELEIRNLSKLFLRGKINKQSGHAKEEFNE